MFPGNQLEHELAQQRRKLVWKILPPRWKVMMIKQEVKTAHEHIFSSFINFFHFSPPSFLTHINLTHKTHNFVARFQNFLTHEKI